MKNNNITLYSPENWGEVTFKQWRLMLAEMHKLDVSDKINLLRYRVKQAQILNPQYTEKQIGQLTLPQLQQYFTKIEFLDDEPVKEIWDEFEINGETYKLINYKNLSLEMWIDGEKYTSMEDAHKLIALFYLRPDTYSEEKLDEIAQFIDTQPCGRVFYLISFFFFTHKALELATSLYSDQLTNLNRKIERVKETDQKIKNLKSKVMKAFGLTS